MQSSMRWLLVEKVPATFPVYLIRCFFMQAVAFDVDSTL